MLCVKDNGSARWALRDYASLLLVMAVAVALRTAFHAGMLYSDDLTYVDRAVRILNGDWSVTTYVGGLRYGVNLPMALSMKILGRSEFAANLWPLVCSVAEVALVFVAARSMFGGVAAVLSALVLGLLPVHVHYAGRVMADPPLGFLVTLAFVAFMLAEKRKSAVLYGLAGLSCGAIIWVKEMVMPLIAMSFLFYALLTRTWRLEWLWAIGGVIVAVLANFAFFAMVAGDPLFVVKAMTGGVQTFMALTALATGSTLETSPFYYLWKLFVDIRHVWLMGYLAVAGLVIVYVSRSSHSVEDDSQVHYIVFWALVLLGIFSLAPGSLHPFRLIWKQPNYLLIFAAPFCILGGYALSRFPLGLRAGSLLAYSVGCVLLMAFMQVDLMAFTSNGRAAVTMAAVHPDERFYGFNATYRVALARSMFESGRTDRVIVGDINELWGQGSAGIADRSRDFFVVIDMETATWGRNPIRSLKEVPSCWIEQGRIKPSNVGAGYRVLSAVAMLAGWLPGSVRGRIVHKLDGISTPEPALIFRVTPECRLESAS